MRTVETTTSTRKLADGYLNLKVTDNNGKQHSFKVGIGLFNDRTLDKKFLANPELFNNLVKEGKVSATLWVAGTSEDDIEF
jgi:hypothetical protein